jgi:hypothetical protein
MNRKNILQKSTSLIRSLFFATLIVTVSGCSESVQTSQEKKLLQEACSSWITNSLSVANISILRDISKNFIELAKIDEIYIPVAVASEELIKTVDLLERGELFGKDKDNFEDSTALIFSACNGQIKIKK